MAAAIQIPAAVKDKYDMGDEVARGKFGVVFRSTSKKTKQPCAVKIMLKKGNKKADVEKEVDVLTKLCRPSGHVSIMAMEDYFECDKEYILVTEWLDGGELFDYVIEKDYLDEAEATYYMKQILEGLDYMHAKNIVHLDLKPENVVLQDKAAKQLKIIDFGAAQDLNIDPKVKVMVGTPEFIAPEVLNFEPVTCASDMWAIGVITYVLLTGMSPFLGDNDMETVNNLAAGEYEYPDPDPEDGYEDISKLAKEFIDSFLHLNAKRRATAKQSLTHPWLTSTASGTSRIGTQRLKTFRARRKWLAMIRAVRVSVGLLARIKKGALASANSDECTVSPTGGTCPNEVFDH